MQGTLQGEREELASCSGTLYMPTFSARADSAKYVDIYYPKPQGFDPKWVLRFFLDMCLLVPPGLSKCSFPASLVPPWCLAGCPSGPFLPPWCFLAPPRLSKWSFPASLVVPGASLVPPGCPNGPFLPSWCLPRSWGLPACPESFLEG